MKEYLQRIKHTLKWGEFHRHRWEKEILWAKRYNDTIRDLPVLANTALSPGGVAAGYSLLYFLVRVLRHGGISSVLEIGLGQSTVLIDQWMKACLPTGNHLVLEDDKNWIAAFQHLFSLQAEIRHYIPLNRKDKTFSGGYSSAFANIPIPSFDLYLIDGPRGSQQYSRFEICLLAEQWNSENECIIILDDYDRWGERQTGAALIRICEKNGMKITHRVINGLTDQLVIFTPKYNICRSF